ncbi:MAG: DsbA family protein, partial [Hyphomicrobiaceae bacterium]
ASPPSVEAPTATAPAAAAQPPASHVPSSFTPQQRTEIEGLIKSYLLNNPELMLEVQNAYEAKMEKVQAERMSVALKEHAKDLFHPKVATLAGNPKGDVTVVEFFDYNCGYCKRAIGDVARVVDKDKNVKVVLKEFPILAPGSEEASKVALAARMQGKYWEFHRAMLTHQGQANMAVALKVAEGVGLDMDRLKKDITLPEVQAEINHTRELAQNLGIQGTPYFLVGDKIIPGAPENLYDLINQNVATVRKSGCSVC